MGTQDEQMVDDDDLGFSVRGGPRGRPFTAVISAIVVLGATLLVLTTAGLSPAAAQDPATSGIDGSVSTADGVGVGDVKVDLFVRDENGRRGQFLGTTRTDSDGGFTFDVDPGCYVLTVVSPDERRFNGSRWFQPSGCVEAGERLTGIDARFDGQPNAALGGTVVGNLGTPVAGVKANLFSEGRARFLGLGVTDDDGVFGFDVAAGCYVVTVIAPGDDLFIGGSRFFQRNICLSPGQENTALIARLDVSLIEPSTIGGTIISSIDEGVEGVKVTAYRATESGGRGEFLGRAFTGADGRWTFDVTEGCYRFIAVAPENDGFGSTFNQYFAFPTQCVGADEQVLTLQARLRQPNWTSVSMTTGRSYLEGGPGQTKTAQVQVSLNDRATFPVTVNLRTVDGTATAADGDYSPVDITVRFEPGEALKTVPVTIYGDDQAEVDERFYLVLSNPQPAAGVFMYDDIFPVIIRNDDEPVPINEPAITAINDVFNESDGTVSGRLFVSGGPLAAPGSVDVTTISTNAVPGEDYRVTTTRVDLPAGGGDFSFPMELLDDDIPETTESFLVVLSNPTSGISLAKPFAIIRIRDDDQRPS